MTGLSNTQQALLMLFTFMLPPVIAWLGLGMPMDKTALGILGSSILSGVLAFIKELLGGKAPESTATPAASEVKPTA